LDDSIVIGDRGISSYTISTYALMSFSGTEYPN